MIIRHIDRYGEILRVLARHGFADAIEGFGLTRVLPGWRWSGEKPESRTEVRARHLRLALEELGPTFIKLGQVMSTRADLLPSHYIHELEQLQDEVPPFPYEVARGLVERELGKPVAELFRAFDPVPMASASLAQVHAAELFSGDKVVVKVQRPHVRETIDKDMDVLRTMARVAASRSKYGQLYDLPGLVDELGRTIREEIDFVQERHNMETIAGNLEEFDLIYVPLVYPELSSERVLTMERVGGAKVSEARRLDIDHTELAEQFTRAYIKQVTIDGVFHADPHPGNLFVRRDGSIAMVDFGMVGRIDRHTRRTITRLILAFMQEQGADVARAAMQLGQPPEDMDVRGFERSISVLVARYHNLPLREVNIGVALIETLQVATNYRLRIPGSLSLLGKTLLYAENVARQIDPQLNLVESIRSYSEGILLSQLTGEINRVALASAALDISDLVISAPRDVRSALDRLANGQARLQLDHVGLHNLTETLQRAANRVALAVIIAGLLVASALYTAGAPGGLTILGISAPGIISFVIGLLLVIYMLIRVIRSPHS